MTAPTAFNTFGQDLEKMLILRTHPIAIKLLKSEDEVPEGAIRPKKDRGEHYAVCQVFSLVRRQGLAVAMFLEDHWCYAPIISYGLVETPDDYLEGFTTSYFIADKEAAAAHAQETAQLPVGDYPGMAFAPLTTANFEPDLTMIYCVPGQLRHLLLGLRYLHGREVTSTFDPIGSCIHSVVTPFLSQECAVTLPDPGDYERAGALEEEIVLTVPTARLDEMMEGLYHFEESGRGYRSFGPSLHPDFKQPPFYEDYFRRWGLDGPKE